MSDLPERIRIGGFDYAVIQKEDLRDGDTGLNGWIRYNSCEILIDAGLSEQVKFATVWHEVVHGILEHAGIEHDEQVVVALGYGIPQVLRDNPFLHKGEYDNGHAE